MIQAATLKEVVRYSGAFGSNAASGGSEQIVAPASNTAGLVVWCASICQRAGAALIVSLLAKTAAPASNLDGDVLLAQATETNVSLDVTLERAILVPAGKGLYFYASVGITHGIRTCLYSLLA